MTWLMENLGTILVGAVVLLIVILAIRRLVLNHKTGQGSCSCGCENCAMHSRCGQGTTR